MILLEGSNSVLGVCECWYKEKTRSAVCVRPDWKWDPSSKSREETNLKYIDKISVHEYPVLWAYFRAEKPKNPS